MMEAATEFVPVGATCFVDVAARCKEKSPTLLCACGEKPYSTLRNISDHEEKPYIHGLEALLTFYDIKVHCKLSYNGCFETI